MYNARIVIPEETNVNKKSAKDCDIFHYWYFSIFIFKVQLNVCKRSRDLLMSMNLSSIAILNIKGFDYRFIISLISKNGPINLMENNYLGKNRGTFKIEKSIKKIESIYKN